uniref:non-specific serine/threonine protein kinase n=1 Tax=Strigops habroptila TaxID=2489341 RepID=A0A672UBY0_STRHB
MATGERLFDPQPGKYFSRDDGRTPPVLLILLTEMSQSLSPDVFSLCPDHVARIIELLGRIPPQIAYSWNKSTKFFSKPGALLRISRLCPRSLHTILSDRHHWATHEASTFASFLLAALHYAPQRRATAAQCLQHAWLSAL